MPLRAKLNDEELIATRIPDERWAFLKSSKAVPILSCCSSEAYLRVSPLGTKHFVHKHKAGTCYWQSETYEHLRVKEEILTACWDAGWNAVPEVKGDNWIADVVASRDTQNVVFEIQISGIAWQEIKERHQSYKNAGLSDFWFFRSLPRIPEREFGHGQQIDIPLTSVESTDDIFYAVVGSVYREPLKEFIKLILSRCVVWNNSRWNFTKQKPSSTTSRLPEF